MTKLKWFFSLCLFHSLLLSHFYLSFQSSFNLCLCVFSDWYTHFTKISCLRNPKWVWSHDKQINFYRLESCWSWKLFDYLQDGRRILQPSFLARSLSESWASFIVLVVVSLSYTMCEGANIRDSAEPFVLKRICQVELQNVSEVGEKIKGFILRSLNHC